MYNYKIIDNQTAYTSSYIGTVFRRNPNLKTMISFWRWTWLTILEIVVGAELLENIIISGSVFPHENITKKDDSTKFGNELHLTLHIPSGFITNFFRPKIIELLYYKFCCQYLLLHPVGETSINHNKKTIDCTRTRFRANKELFYQLIAFRRVYEISWLGFNLLVDILVLYFSYNINWAIISAISVEAIRRLLKS
jgi:hypothetical protein